MSIVRPLFLGAFGMGHVRSFPWERIHYFDCRTGDVVASTGHRFVVRQGGSERTFEVPAPRWTRYTSARRWVRRWLRMDQHTVTWGPSGDALIVASAGRIYRYEFGTGRLSHAFQMPSKAALLHTAIGVSEDRLVLGAYRSNVSRAEIFVWTSEDGGRQWQVCHVFPAGELRHVHGVSWDPIGQSFWVTTGDEDGECYLYRFDRQMKHPRRYGDGSQAWRAIDLVFTEHAVMWGMDAPGRRCTLNRMDRQTGRLTRGANMRGPVWYAKALADGVVLFQTTVEPGVGVDERFVHLWALRDEGEPQLVARIPKDGWPAWPGRYGQVLFASGYQTSEAFALSAIALRGHDGIAVCARLGDSVTDDVAR